MQVNVIDALPGIGAAIYDRAITGIGNTQLGGNFARRKHELAQQRRMIGIQLVQRCNVLARNHQHVHRRARIDVVKRKNIIIFIRDARGNATARDATEQAGLLHHLLSPCAMGLPHLRCQTVRMKIDTLLRAAQILRAQPAHCMPLQLLHGKLTLELGAQVGSYAQFHAELKKRPESFMLLDSPRLLPQATEWPAHVREAYDCALDGAGLGSCQRVALTDIIEPAGNDAISLASCTISELWPAAEKDATLRNVMQRASDQLAEISSLLAEAERPTTRPPDLPPAP